MVLPESQREALRVCPVFLQACFVIGSVHPGMGDAEGSGSASLPPQLSSSILAPAANPANMKTNSLPLFAINFPLLQRREKNNSVDNITYSRLCTENLAVQSFLSLLGALV